MGRKLLGPPPPRRPPRPAPRSAICLSADPFGSRSRGGLQMDHAPYTLSSPAIGRLIEYGVVGRGERGIRAHLCLPQSAGPPMGGPLPGPTPPLARPPALHPEPAGAQDSPGLINLLFLCLELFCLSFFLNPLQLFHFHSFLLPDFSSFFILSRLSFRLTSPGSLSLSGSSSSSSVVLS